MSKLTPEDGIGGHLPSSTAWLLQEVQMVAAIGMTALGFVMCYLCMYFVVRFKAHTATGFSAVVGILLGGVVAKFLTENTIAGTDTIWWYPIGLLIGLISWAIVRRIQTVVESRELIRAGVPAGQTPSAAPAGWDELADVMKEYVAAVEQEGEEGGREVLKANPELDRLLHTTRSRRANTATVIDPSIAKILTLGRADGGGHLRQPGRVRA